MEGRALAIRAEDPDPPRREEPNSLSDGPPFEGAGLFLDVQ